MLAFGKYLLLVILGVLLMCVISYMLVPVYKFSLGAPFSGDRIYNPYAQIDSTAWRKANFHCHQKEKPQCNYTVDQMLDAYYQKIRDAGIKPDDGRTDKNKPILLNALNAVAADLSDRETGMIIPERAGALVIGGRYYRRKFEEPTTEPAFVKGGAPAPLSKDESGNVLKNENGIYRTVRVKPGKTPSVTSDDVIRRIRETPSDPVPELIF